MEQKPVILIVDKNNLFGQAIGESLVQFATVLLVTKSYSGGDLLFAPFTSPIPTIPDGIFANIIFVFEKEEEHLLEPLIKKAENLHAQLFVVAEAPNAARVKNVLPSSAVLFVVGDLFGGGIVSELDVLVKSAKTTKRLSLPNMGLRLWHPVLYRDAIAVIASFVVSHKHHGTFLLGAGHGVTSLSIAHALQKIDPDIAVDFSDHHDVESEQEQHSPSALENYDAVVKIRAYYSALVVGGGDKKQGKVMFGVPRKTKRGGRLAYSAYLVIVVIFLPLVVTLTSWGAGLLFLHSSVGQLQKGNAVSAMQQVAAASASFSFAQSAALVVSQEATVVGQHQTAVVLQENIANSSNLAQLLKQGMQFAVPLGQVLRGTSVNPKQDVEKSIAALTDLSTLLTRIHPSGLPAQYEPFLAPVQQLVNIGTSVSSSLPYVLGIPGDRAYLVLLQNNMELRPGGGFIGSYGLLRLHSGAVKSFTIHDVYDADGQLKGHIEPPFAIRRYIPIVHLYLRDSNFDADFPNNAKTAASLLFDETGERVDGVVGIDLSVLRALLSAAGGVYVPSYNQTVTEGNFFQLLETHAEKNFFPGSTQKKDFLRAFANALLALLQNGQKFHAADFVPKLTHLIDGKHIQLAFSDPLVQLPFSLAGVSGALPPVSTGGSGDFLGIVEANLGVNKVNAFVTRALSQNVTIHANGDVTEKVVIHLVNNSDGSWPGGDYRSYIRLMVPGSARLDDIALNGVSQRIVPAVINPTLYEAKSFVAPRGLEVASEKEAGKTLYGVLVNVPTKSALDISFSYTIQKVFAVSGAKQTYTSTIWKQAGIDTFPFSFTLMLPENAQMLSGTIPVDRGSRMVTYSSSIEKDTPLQISFSLEQ